jgi:thymidylate kinase
MIVEFAGLPGSGKTTLRNAVAAELTSRGWPVEARHVIRPSGDRFRALVHRARSAGAYPGVCRSAVQAMAGDSRPMRERAFALRLTAVTLDNYRWLRGRETIGLIDEGLLQRGFLLFTGTVHAAPTKAMSRYVRALPVPDLVVHLRLDSADVRTRLGDRQRFLPPRYARLAMNELPLALSAGAQVLDEMLQQLNARVERPLLLTLDARTSLAEAVALVTACTEKLAEPAIVR